MSIPLSIPTFRSLVTGYAPPEEGAFVHLPEPPSGVTSVFYAEPNLSFALTETGELLKDNAEWNANPYSVPSNTVSLKNIYPLGVYALKPDMELFGNDYGYPLSELFDSGSDHVSISNGGNMFIPMPLV